MARESWLRDITPIACSREIQLLCQRKEITNLVHFHKHHPINSDAAIRFAPKVVRERAKVKCRSGIDAIAVVYGTLARRAG
jgi:hypothetical protein